MAAKVTTRKWEDVVGTIVDDSGMPKKQVVDTAEAIHKGIAKELSSHQPKRDGDKLEVKTLDAKYVIERLPETVITDANGNKFTRPSCCAVNCAISADFISAANIGLVDDAAVEKEGKVKNA